VSRRDASIATPLPALCTQVWRHALGVRRRLGLAMAMLTGSQLLRLAMPWVAAQAINTLQASGTAALPRAGAWIGVILALAFGMWALHGPGRVIERDVAVHVRRRVADALYARLASAPLAWHDRHHSGELQHRAQLATAAPYEFTQSQFIYLQSAVNLLGPVLALALLSPATGTIALAGYTAIIAVIVLFDSALMRWADREPRHRGRHQGLSLEGLAALGRAGRRPPRRLCLEARRRPWQQGLLERRRAVPAGPLRDALHRQRADRGSECTVTDRAVHQRRQTPAARRHQGDRH
jgi:ABC-type multidrug transport system fused ATPase/permease subunit